MTKEAIILVLEFKFKCILHKTSSLTNYYYVFK